MNVINRHLRNFFWSGGTHSKKLHRVRWDFIARPKEFGGLGVLDISIQNKALLTKWLWRLHDESEALWARIIRQKYLVKRIDNIFVSTSRHYSSVWRDISQVILANDTFNVVLLNCLSFEVGDGHTILFWHDYWACNSCFKDLFTSLFSISTQPCDIVSNFGNYQDSCWMWKLNWVGTSMMLKFKSIKICLLSLTMCPCPW